MRITFIGLCGPNGAQGGRAAGGQGTSEYGRRRFHLRSSGLINGRLAVCASRRTEVCSRKLALTLKRSSAKRRRRFRVGNVIFGAQERAFDAPKLPFRFARGVRPIESFDYLVSIIAAVGKDARDSIGEFAGEFPRFDSFSLPGNRHRSG